MKLEEFKRIPPVFLSTITYTLFLTVHKNFPNIAVCAVYSPYTREKIFRPFDPLVLRYSNITIYSRRYNAIPTATLETSRWDVQRYHS
jgi:hypothetical protein